MDWILWWALGGLILLVWLQAVKIRDLEAERDWWQREARARLEEVEAMEAAERDQRPDWPRR